MTFELETPIKSIWNLYSKFTNIEICGAHFIRNGIRAPARFSSSSASCHRAFLYGLKFIYLFTLRLVRSFVHLVIFNAFCSVYVFPYVICEYVSSSPPPSSSYNVDGGDGSQYRQSKFSSSGFISNTSSTVVHMSSVWLSEALRFFAILLKLVKNWLKTCFGEI